MVKLEDERRHGLVRFPDCEFSASILSGLDEFFAQRFEKPLGVHHVEENLFKVTFKRIKGKDRVTPLMEQSKNWPLFVRVRESTRSPYFQVEFTVKRATVKICRFERARCNHCLNGRNDFKAHDMAHRGDIQFCVQVLKVPKQKQARYAYLDAEVKKVAGKLRRAIQNQQVEKVSELEEKKRAMNREKNSLVKGERRAEEMFYKVYMRTARSQHVTSQPASQPKVNAWARAKSSVKRAPESKPPPVYVAPLETHAQQLQGHSDSGSASPPSRRKSLHEEEVVPASSVSSWENYRSSSASSSAATFRESSPSPLPYSGPPQATVKPQNAPPYAKRIQYEEEPRHHTPEPVIFPAAEKSGVSIREFLRQIRLEQYGEVLESFEISVEVLATDVDTEDLEGLGITSKFHRHKLITRAKKYHGKK